MAVSSRSSRRPRAATAARASCDSIAVIGPTSANLSCKRVMRCRARAVRSCGSQDAQEGGAHFFGAALVVGEQLLARARSRVSHPPRQAQQLGAALRKAIDRAVAHDAEPGLEAPEEEVAARERGVVLGAQVPATEQQREGLRRAGG